MPSRIDIVNAALLELGQPALLSLDDDSDAARLAKATYDLYRDALLRENPWRFAMARAELVLDTEDPVWGFDRAFHLPEDTLRILEMEGDGPDPFQHAWQVEGKRLVTNSSEARVRYIRKITSESEFDASFTQALIHRLASSWSEALVKDENVSQRRDNHAERWQSAASGSAGQEGTPEVIEASTWINSR